MKRIAILSPGYPPTGGGGVASAQVNLYKALKKLGHDVHVFTFSDDAAAPVPPGGDITRSRGLPRWLTTVLAKVFEIIVLRPWTAKMNVFQCRDVLRGATGGLMAFRKIRRFRPEILIVSDHGAPSALFGRIPGCIVIFVSHHNAARFRDEPLISKFSLRDSELAHRAEQWALRRADIVVCPSHYMREVFRRTYSFSGPVEVIPNVADLDYLSTIPAADIRPRFGLSKDSPVIYLPSAGSPFKGSRYIFEIVRRIALGYGGEIGFYLSGSVEQPLLRELEFLPKNSRLIIPGRLPYETNIGYVATCDICVSPTLAENFSMALLEAQACGLPVVTFDVGGNCDLIEAGVTGHLVPVMDIDTLIERSLELLSDGNARQTMSQMAKERVLKRFDPDSLAAAYVHCGERDAR